MSNEDFDPAPWLSAYRRMHSAIVAGDTRTLRELISDAFVLIHMTGYAQSGGEWLEHIQSGKMRYLSSVEESVTVMGAGNGRWLRGQNRVRAEIWGAHGTWPLRLDIRFTQERDQWRMLKVTASTY